MDKRKATMFDPPSGWRYGFPRPIPPHVEDNDDYFRLWLLEDCGYPEKDFDLAMKHSRYWIVEVDEEE